MKSDMAVLASATWAATGDEVSLAVSAAYSLRRGVVPSGFLRPPWYWYVLSHQPLACVQRCDLRIIALDPRNHVDLENGVDLRIHLIQHLR